MLKRITLSLLLALSFGSVSFAADEDDYYALAKFQLPEGVVLEGGGLEMMPDGKLAASSRRGEIYMIANDLKQADSRVAKYFRRALDLNPDFKRNRDWSQRQLPRLRRLQALALLRHTSRLDARRRQSTEAAGLAGNRNPSDRVGSQSSAEAACDVRDVPAVGSRFTGETSG